MWRLCRTIAACLKNGPARFGAGKLDTGRPLAVMAWWAFVLSMISGIIVSFNYRPWGDVFKNVSKMTGWLSYGTFFRSFHYLSGQCFLLFTIVHTFEHFLRASYHRLKAGSWTRLVLVFALSFPLVLTGFILKGDKEGIHAGQVMARLTAQIPLIGPDLSRCFIRPGEEFFYLPYLHHAVIIPLSIIFLLNVHRRRFFQGSQWELALLASLAVLAVFYPLPVDIPPRAEVEAVTGPWFFHGIQLLLRHFPAFWAGVVWPMIPVALLVSLAWVRGGALQIIRWITAICWALHLALIIAGWILLPGTWWSG